MPAFIQSANFVCQTKLVVEVHDPVANPGDDPFATPRFPIHNVISMDKTGTINRNKVVHSSSNGQGVPMCGSQDWTANISWLRTKDGTVPQMCFGTQVAIRVTDDSDAPANYWEAIIDPNEYNWASDVSAQTDPTTEFGLDMFSHSEYGNMPLAGC